MKAVQIANYNASCRPKIVTKQHQEQQYDEAYKKTCAEVI
jgi:hypothetical protein